MKAIRLCSIDGCGGPVRGHGWCNKHHLRWRKYGDPLTRTRSPVGCAVAGCRRRYEASGYCTSHLARLQLHGDPVAPRQRRPPSTCSVVDCELRARVRGWCSKHYWRWATYGDVSAAVRAYGRAGCRIDGCDRPHFNNDFCERHNRRLRLYGDPLHVEPRGPKRPLRGPLNPAWKGTRAGYRAAHNRIYEDRGRASAQVCLHCGGGATEWAYFHADPDEVYAPGKGLYSHSPRFYEALCGSCHRRYDAWWAFAEFGGGPN